MTLLHAAFLFAVAFIAGVLNSVAGGGSFLSFPALIFTGMPPINANATNTAALWPGTAASVAAYRQVISGHKREFLPLVLTGITGGLLGAVVLLRTPQATFMKMIPWLLLSATLLLTFSRQITRTLGPLMPGEGDRPSRKGILAGAVVQLCIAIYIGFFGAGAGILMMAMFAIMGVRSIHTINGLRTMLATICNGVAIIAFIYAGAIVWPQALLMLVGAALGGYGGAWYAQKLPPRFVRWFAITTGFIMTAWFFVKTA
jgi:uncharacterized membrane protein YfcA